MKKMQATFCLLLSLAMLLACIPMAFSAAAEEAAAAAPLTVQVQMSKSAYFVTAKAKATISVQNTGATALKDIAVSAFSGKHLIAAGSSSTLLIPELEAGQKREYSFEIVLDRKTAGVTFYERILLFFAQLFRSYEPMQGIPLMRAAVTQEIDFRHGSTNSVLQVGVFCQENDPDGTVRPNVTYLDKYVIDILDSGSYTAEMSMNSDDTDGSVTIYYDGENQAIELTAPLLQVFAPRLPDFLSKRNFTVRIVFKDMSSSDPKVYLVLPGSYFEMENLQDGSLPIDSDAYDYDVQSLFRQLLQVYDAQEYCGVTYGDGYICESYRNSEENTQMNYYFSEAGSYSGLVRMEVIDLDDNSTDSQTDIRLTAGVTNDKAFTVSGIKRSIDDLAKYAQ